MRWDLTNLLATSVLVAPLGAQETPRIELEPKTIDAGSVTYDADVGRLFVSEKRSDPDANTIELPVVILRTTSDDPAPPLVFLAGGPGNPAVPLARRALLIKLSRLLPYESPSTQRIDTRPRTLATAPRTLSSDSASFCNCALSFTDPAS